MVHISDHARRRSRQRAIRAEHIALARCWGAEIKQADGRRAFHLGRREAARATAMGHVVPEAAVGVAVVEALDGTLVTAVRSGDRKRLRRKGWKRDRRRRSRYFA